MLWTNN